MLIIEDGFVDVPTPSGPMRCYVYRPKEGVWPGLVFYSEIFQQTGPIKRTAAFLAGHGFCVFVPEVYHELLPIGTVLSYTPEDSALGNKCKTDKELASYDADAAAAVDALRAHPFCTGKVGVAGVCLGGGLAFRAAAVARGVSACVCWYPTDLHKGSVGFEAGSAGPAAATAAAAEASGGGGGGGAAPSAATSDAAAAAPASPVGGGIGKGGDDSLARARDIRCKLLFFFGKQDPHIPGEGRKRIYDIITAAGLVFEWHEVNGAHAFLRDENSFGRYDPALAASTYDTAVKFLTRTLRS